MEFLYKFIFPRLVQEIRSITRHTSSSIPGVNVSHIAPLLAQCLIPYEKAWARSADRVDGGRDTAASSSSDDQSRFDTG